jgi:hypothetical protein
MIAVESGFGYGISLGEGTLRALASLREVYGVRQLRVDRQQRHIVVEFDASRISHEQIAGLLRKTGVDLLDRQSA